MSYARGTDAPRIETGLKIDSLLDQWLSEGETLVAHNACFEFACVLAHKPAWASRLFEMLDAGRLSCTLVREKLIRIGRGDRREGFGLDVCLSAWGLPVVLDKKSHWRLRYGELHGKPVAQWPQEAVDYSLGDVAVRELWHAQETAGEALLCDEAAQVRASVALHLVSCWGMQTDPDAARALLEATEADIETHQQRLQEAGLLKRVKKQGVLVPSKDKKAAEARLVAAYARMGLDAPRGDVTEKMGAKGVELGNIKLDEEACLQSRDPVLESYTFFSQANTLRAKVRRLQRSPIQASYNVLVNTGRTSCRQGDDPKPGEAWTTYGMNTQNLPRAEGTRECFVPRAGSVFVSIDFDAFELRTWSQVCLDLLGFSDMAEVLRDPARCPHVEMGAAVESISAEAAYALKKTNPKAFKALRQVAKSLNFGAPGGLGAARFGDFARGTYGIDVTEQRAKELLQLWRTRWREAGAYLDMITDMVGARGNRITIQHVRSKRLRGSVGFCDSANSFFQGLAADAAKAGLYAVVRETFCDRTSPAYGCRVVAFIHDEIVVEVPEDRLHEAAYRLRDTLVTAAQVYVPDVPLTASPAACRRWSKAAGDPVHDAQGRLICWEDR